MLWADLKSRTFKVTQEDEEWEEEQGETDSLASSYAINVADEEAEASSASDSFVQLQLKGGQLKIELGLNSRSGKQKKKGGKPAPGNVEMELEMWSASHTKPLKQHPSLPVLASNGALLTHLSLARSVSGDNHPSISVISISSQCDSQHFKHSACVMYAILLLMPIVVLCSALLCCCCAVPCCVVLC